MKIAVRTDASRQIGTGHVMRCLALCEALTARGAQVHFITRELSGHITDAIQQRAYPVHLLPPPSAAGSAGNGTAHADWLEIDAATDAEQTLVALHAIGKVDVLVVDHFALDAAWEHHMRPAAAKIFVIDDLADRPHDCDLLLDQTPAQAGRYRDRVAPECQVLQGPAYALLRSEFAQWRACARVRDGRLRRLFVSFGGVDHAAQTENVIEAVRLLARPEIQVDVVAGMANARAAELRRQCERLPQIRFHHAPRNLPELMLEADAAVGAGGVMLWERTCLGLPSLAVVTAENQRPVLQELAETGQLLVMEGEAATPQALAQALAFLGSQPALLRRMSELNLGLADGRGTERVARVLLTPAIVLRRGRESDRDAVFAWRNAGSVRRLTHNPAAIPRETHDRWFSATLQNPDRLLLIAEHGGRPVGVLRYDIKDRAALVSIYLVPGETGQGYGAAILRSGTAFLRQARPEVSRIDAEILRDNAASRRAFEEAGYSLEHLHFRQTLHA